MTLCTDCSSHRKFHPGHEFDFFDTGAPADPKCPGCAERPDFIILRPVDLRELTTDWPLKYDDVQRISAANLHLVAAARRAVPLR
jgi:hypothetical protein